MCQVHIGASVPAAADLVADLGISAVLLETHVGAVAVRAVVRAGHDAREAAFADAVGCFGLQGVPRAVAHVQVGFHAFLALPAGDDVDHPAHGVRAVEHRRRSAHHLDPLGEHRLVGVGDRMAEQPHVLRMPVDQHEHLGRRPSADAAQADASGRAVRDAVTHHAASRDEQPRNLFREQRKHRCLLPADDFVAVHDRHRHRQVADVRGVARPRHHHRVDRDVLRRLPGLLRGLLCAVCGAGSRAGQ